MSRRSLFKSSNPMMSNEKLAKVSGLARRGEVMTVQGAVNKTFILASIMLTTAYFGFMYPSSLFMWGGMIGALIMVVWASFKPHMSPILAPIYAAFEGLFVGAISYMYAGIGNGLIFQAVTLTMAILFAMLFLYKTGIIKVTEKLRSGIMIATGGIMLVYLLNMVLHMFGMNVPYLHEGGMIGIGISLFIIGIASMNLLLDFDFFDKGAASGAPSYMEWFAGMGLLVTLVWIYIEILRLLAVLNRD